VTAVASLTRVWVVVNHAHNAYSTAKINKVKDFALIFWSVSLPHQDSIFCQQPSWANVFIRNFFAHIHLMRCLSSLWHFYWCQVYIAASKEYLRRIQIIYIVLESPFH